MSFDRMNDPIVLTVPSFTLLKHVDGPFQRYNEPYLVSMAVDERGSANPAIEFSFMPFPKVRAGGSVTFIGDGHLIYGPRNPGSFVAVSVLMMESDKDMQNLGATIQAAVQSEAVALGMKAVLAAHPGAAATLGILKELCQFVGGLLKNNGDDELFRMEGTFLRDQPAPYHVDSAYDVGNDYASLKLAVRSLSRHDKEKAPAPVLLPL